MPWNNLYKRRNESDDLFWPLSKYVEDALELQWVDSLEVSRSKSLRKQHGWGFYYRVQGPEQPCVRDKFVILTANDHDNAVIDKVVSIKEIMHCYENSFDRFVDTPEKLSKLVNHFYGKPLTDGQEHFITSEPVAYWRAVSVVTTETHRQTIKAEILAADDQDAMIAAWAWRLRMPDFIVEALISDLYESSLEQIKKIN